MTYVILNVLRLFTATYGPPPWHPPPRTCPAFKKIVCMLLRGILKSFLSHILYCLPVYMCGHACQRTCRGQRTTWGIHLADPGWHFVSACEVRWVSNACGSVLYFCLAVLSLGGRVVLEASVMTAELSRICLCFLRLALYI